MDGKATRKRNIMCIFAFKYHKMQTSKICVSCLEEKSLDKFYKTQNIMGKKIYTNYRSKCKKCVNKQNLQKQRDYRKLNKEKIRENEREYRMKKLLNDPLYRAKVNLGQRTRYERYAVGRMLRNAKERAVKNNLEFTINPDLITIPEFCPILEIPIYTGTKSSYKNSPSLDRIDNSKGYIDGNIAVISTLANSMKNCATLEQLLIFSKNIIKYIHNKDIV